jgi:hypothetical protein
MTTHRSARSMIVALSALAVAACGLKTDTKTDPKTDPNAAVEREAEQQPVQPLVAYVPSLPDVDSASQREQPSVGGLPSGTVWDETTNQTVAQVVRYYSDDGNHPGWQVEFSAANGMVLRRTVTSLGHLENERMRIQAMPNPDVHGKRTEVEFELTRRLK